MNIPSYLQHFQKTGDEPGGRAAALRWFAEAKFGLFLHYGLYSLLGRGEWVMYKEQIPVAQYEKLQLQFTAHRFDAGAIADLAIDAGMQYITITTRHHDSFCLFQTRETDFNSLQAPCGRDLVGELAQACRERDLGLFLYYSYGADWRHPYFFAREAGCDFARPAYDVPDPSYRWQKDEDMAYYIEFMHNQLRELLSGYGPIAGVWFDPILPFYLRPDLFPIEETYALIRSLQPHCLISFKQGANGEEDFAAPEFAAHSLEDRVRGHGGGNTSVAVAHAAWEKNKNKHNEICACMHPSWGYQDSPDEAHKTPSDVLAMLANAAASRCNLLLNTGPLPDGSVHAVDAATLRAVGHKLRTVGFPVPSPTTPAFDSHDGLA